MAFDGVSRRAALRTIAAGIVWVDKLRGLAQQHSMDARVLEPLQATTWRPQVLSPHQLASTGILVELIIPATDTPGAKELQVDRYIDSVLASAAASDRKKFLAGFAWLDRRCRFLFRREFVSATPAQQIELLTRMSGADARTGEASAGVEFFAALKMLTIAGYYTTEIGLRQELGDDGRMVLAAFEGCNHKEHE